MYIFPYTLNNLYISDNSEHNVNAMQIIAILHYLGDDRKKSVHFQDTFFSERFQITVG